MIPCLIMNSKPNRKRLEKYISSLRSGDTFEIVWNKNADHDGLENVKQGDAQRYRSSIAREDGDRDADEDIEDVGDEGLRWAQFSIVDDGAYTWAVQCPRIIPVFNSPS